MVLRMDFFVWETFCPESYTVVFVDQLIPLKVVSSLCGMAPTVGEGFAPRTTKLELVRRSIMKYYEVWWTYNNCRILRYIEFMRNPLSVGEDVAPRIPTSLAHLGCQFPSDLGRHLKNRNIGKPVGEIPKTFRKNIIYPYIYISHDIPWYVFMIFHDISCIFPWYFMYIPMIGYGYVSKWGVRPGKFD